MSVARQRARSARKIAAKRSALAGNSQVLATGTGEQDNMRVGMIEAPRKVIVTERVSIKRTFNAPRIDMGEYSPVSTHQLELEKQRKGWTIEPRPFGR